MYITPKNSQPTKAGEIKHHFQHQKKGEKKSVLKEENVILSDKEPLSKKKGVFADFSSAWRS